MTCKPYKTTASFDPNTETQLPFPAITYIAGNDIWRYSRQVSLNGTQGSLHLIDINLGFKTDAVQLVGLTDINISNAERNPSSNQFGELRFSLIDLSCAAPDQIIWHGGYKANEGPGGRSGYDYAWSTPLPIAIGENNLQIEIEKRSPSNPQIYNIALVGHILRLYPTPV